MPTEPLIHTISADDFTDVAMGRPARHPTRVTLERVGDHMEKYADQLTPLELAACEKVCRAFADIAEGRRA